MRLNGFLMFLHLKVCTSKLLDAHHILNPRLELLRMIVFHPFQGDIASQQEVITPPLTTPPPAIRYNQDARGCLKDALTAFVPQFLVCSLSVLSHSTSVP